MKTVGEILKKARVEKKLSIEDVEKEIRVRRKFLEALEKDAWEKLPGATYTRGFLKNYINFLGLPENETLAIFRRQFNEREKVKITQSISTPLTEPFWAINPSKITYLAIFLLFFLFFLYLFSEYRSLTNTPHLKVDQPKNGSVVQEEMVTIKGKADRESTLTINNQPISLDKEGDFLEEVALFPGVNKFHILATNKFGKKNEVIIEVNRVVTNGANEESP